MANNYKLEERLHNEMIALGAELKRSGDQSFFWANGRSKARSAGIISRKTILGQFSANSHLSLSLSCVFFNLAKPLLTLACFLLGWSVARSQIGGQRALRRGTAPQSHPHPMLSKKNCLKFPFLSHISILFATYIKAVSKKRYISLKVKSHIQMRIFAIIHVKWF